MTSSADPGRISENLASVRARILAACRKACREESSVTLVAVTKGRPARDAEILASLGVKDLGESRVQEAGPKVEKARDVRWHMIGHLQKNKARKALDLFSCIHSVDSTELLAALDRVLGERPEGEGGSASPAGFPVLVQVNVSGEGTKSGVSPGKLHAFLEAAAGLKVVCVAGLMTMAPWSDDPESSRPHFARLRDLGLSCANAGLLPARFDLSMGMTGDLEVAVEEGSTLVRVGTALFA